MDPEKNNKRKHDKHYEDGENRREKKSKRARSRSRSRDRDRERESRRKRRHSKSRSPNVPVKQEKQNDRSKDAEVKKEGPERPERRAKETDMLNTRTGGAYIPPARLRMMQAQITDKASVAYQRLAWEALKKSIHGHINKINVGNIGIIIKELLKENIVRGRGLLCRSVIQAQAASPTFTNVYAALVAAVNSRFPNIGELLLKRLVIQFKRGFKRNDKAICISSASFIAHLVNQRVAHEILALELLTLLVETPTDDSVEVAIAFLKECGQKLTEVSSKGVNAIFEMLRNILHEGQVDKRVQYMIEVMFQVWKDGFKDHPALIEELELVPEEEQFTHLMMLDEATDPQDILNVFKFDDKYEENEQKYKTLSKEILGSDAESGEEDGSGESGSEEDDDDEEEEAQKEVTIIDNTETNLVALRRTIYLTINSSLDFEECAHKLMKMQLKPGQEVELCHMFLDCCAEQRTYEKFYGLLAQRFCNINRIYIGPFEEIFKDSYGTAHRLDTNRLRNVSKFFAHLLFTDSISWEALECVRLNEEDTTSSSRIYIKILFQELAEYMGLKKLNDRLKDPTLQEAFSGIFPRDNPKNTRFSINFFTSIGLGGLTDELREHLKQMPKNVPPQEIKLDSESSSDSSSDSSSSSSDDSSDSSDSEDEKSKSKKKSDKKSKKKKAKEKNSKNAEEEPKKDTDRWGHDGFYDTYGKDAQRTESRPDRDLRKPEGRERFDDRNGDSRRDTRRDKDNREDGNAGRYDDERRIYEADGRKDERARRDVDRRIPRDDDRRIPREEDRRIPRDENRRIPREEDRRISRDDDRRVPRDDDRTRRNDKNHRDDDGGRKDDDRERRIDDREERNDKNRRDDDRSRRNDDRNKRDENRGRNGDDRNRRDDDRERRNDVREDGNEDRSLGYDRRRRDNNRDNRNGERSRREDAESRNDGRNREEDDHDRRKSGRNEERSRRDDDRSRNDRRVKEDYKDRRDDEDNQESNEGNRRDDRRNRRDNDEDEDKAHRNEKRDRGEDKPRRYENRDRDDDRRRKEEDNSKSRGRRDKDEEADERDESKSLRKVKENERYEKEANHNHKNKQSDDEEHQKSKKKDKKGKKSKKEAEKNKKRKIDKKKPDTSSSESDSDSDSSDSSSDDSSSSSDDSEAPNRYWDNFDVKSRKEIVKQELDVRAVRSKRERS